MEVVGALGDQTDERSRACHHLKPGWDQLVLLPPFAPELVCYKRANSASIQVCAGVRDKGFSLSPFSHPFCHYGAPVYLNATDV